MKMRDVMRTQPWIARESDALGAAQRMMVKLGVRHLPVVSDGKLTGVLSERDLLQYRAKADADEEWWNARVADAMRADPQTAGPDDSLTEVAGRLAVAKIGAMPIVERGKLVGLVTVTDVLGAEVQAAMEPPRPSLATAKDLMTPGPFTVRPETTLLAAARMLATHGMRHLPVIGDSGELVGMISDRDIRDYAGAPSELIKSWQSNAGALLRVDDVMTRAPITVRENTPVMELAGIFAGQAIGALPVVTETGALVGIVSYVDVLRVLAR
jgi:acetoin utilization protein AcuB